MLPCMATSVAIDILPWIWIWICSSKDKIVCGALIPILMSASNCMSDAISLVLCLRHFVDFPQSVASETTNANR